MANGIATLQHLRALEHLYEQGYQDDLIDLTVQKLMERQIQHDETQLAELMNDLADYEQRFNMSSNTFAMKYQSGEMGDDMDVFEWNVLYQMATRLTQSLTFLKAQFQATL